MAMSTDTRTDERRTGTWWLQAGLMLLVVVLVYGYAAGRMAQVYGFNTSGFICLGDRFLPAEQIPAGTIVLPNSPGYDGTFYYVMARDLLMLGDSYRYLDVPAYRYQRMLYPLLAWLFALGREARTPFALLAVNLAAILGGTLAVAAFARGHGRSPWYALFYALLSGLVIALFRDLAGPVALACMMAALAAHSARRPVWSALFMTGAVLARETLVVMVPVLAFDSFVLKRRRRDGLWSLLPLGPLAAWQLYVGLRAGKPAWSGGVRNLGRPLKGVLRHVARVLPSPDHALPEKVYLVVFLAACSLALVLAVWELCRRRDEISLGFLGFSLLPFLMTKHVWVEPWSYGRVLVPGAALLVLSFLRSRNRWHLVPMTLHALCFAVFLDWNKLLRFGHGIIEELWL